MKKIVVMLTTVATVSACAQNASQVSSAYVPTSLYSSHSCSQLKAEQNRIVHQVNTLTGKQNAKAKTDAVAMGVGLVLFWPALFLLAKDAGNTEQLAQAKGNYDAIMAAGQQKGCW